MFDTFQYFSLMVPLIIGYVIVCQEILRIRYSDCDVILYTLIIKPG